MYLRYIKLCLFLGFEAVTVVDLNYTGYIKEFGYQYNINIIRFGFKPAHRNSIAFNNQNGLCVCF